MRLLDDFLHNKPAIRQLLAQFNQANIRWAIFAGSQVAFMTGNRQPTDLDIIVHNDDFRLVAKLMPSATLAKREHCIVTASDGSSLDNFADTITAQLDGTDIDIMAKNSFTTPEGSFKTFLTEVAAEHRLQVDSNGLVVYFVEPFDTVLIKAFMRRGPEQHKFDTADALALSKQHPSPAAYVQARIAETGLSSGARRFLQQLGVVR